MSQVFFIADTHFGHRNICKYRPMFNNPFEHDEYIIGIWNKTIGTRDVVWVLGDMCIKNEEYNMEYLIDRLNGKINVISGNHCYLPYYNHSRIEVQCGLVSKYGFWLSHCPIHPDEMRKKTHNIHGHIHDSKINDSRYINVCCEAIGYKPISLDKLKKDLNL
jgi:calcineurin-like phosphoesterase family protein